MDDLKHENELLTPEELASEFKVQKSWVYNQTRRKGPGSIPCIRCGKYLRFRKSEVLRWLEKKSQR